jgi:hypothetical protein
MAEPFSCHGRMMGNFKLFFKRPEIHFFKHYLKNCCTQRKKRYHSGIETCFLLYFQNENKWRGALTQSRLRLSAIASQQAE